MGNFWYQKTRFSCHHFGPVSDNQTGTKSGHSSNRQIGRKSALPKNLEHFFGDDLDPVDFEVGFLFFLFFFSDF